MSVSNQETVYYYTGNGVSVTFAFNCQVPLAADLEVSIDDVPITSGFTIAGVGNPTGGTITFDVAPANLASVRIARVIALERSTDYQQNGDFLARVVNVDFNRLWMALQQQASSIKRAILVPKSDNFTPAELPKAKDRANKLLGFDANGQPTAYIPESASLASIFLMFAAALGSSLIGFLQAGVGAVVRTVQDKLRESVSVRDFGAVGSGVADDTSAIQRALDTGKNVRFPGPYTYLIKSKLIGKANQTVTLERGATLKVGAAMRSALHWTDCSNVTVRGNGTLDCGALAISGVLFQAGAISPTDFLVEGITITNTAPDLTLQFGGVEVSSTTGAGAQRARRATMRNLTILGTGTHGAIAAYCDGVKFQNNFVDTVANHGFEAVDCTNVAQTSNVVQNCLISGLGVGTHTRHWTITNNVIINCAGDGSITCEHNSTYGTIANNVIRDAYGSSGINVSFGTPGAGDLAAVRNVTVQGNIIHCKAGLLNRYGINFYSSTGPGLGRGVSIQNNVIDGFNVGVAYQYADGGNISGNEIRNLVGADSRVIMAVFATRTRINDNVCDTDTQQHAISLLSYGASECDKCTVSGNVIVASGGATRSMVYIEGSGSHTVSDNYTGGSLHYVDAVTASVLMTGNNGNLAGTPYSGVNILSIGNGNSSQDVAVVAGRRITMGNAAPVAGTWQAGDRCLNIAPSVGSPKGWACTSGGTPGIWVSEGNL